MKRTLYTIFTALALMLILTISTAMADGGFTPNNTFAAVKNPFDDGQRLNLRSSPSEDAPSIAKLYSGAFVWVHREAESGWAEVEVGSMSCTPLQGYVRMEYLDFARERLHLETPVLTVANTTGGDGITLRSSPKMESQSSLGLLPNGTQVTVLAVLPSEWYLVQVGGVTGYVAKMGFAEDLGGYGEEGGSNVSMQAPAWDGPTGQYATADWPIVINEYVGFISNPDPTERLHLRTAPSTDAPSLGKYYNGVRFVINSNADADWVRVSIGGLEGYLKAEYTGILGMDEVPSAMPVVTINDPGSTEGVVLRQYAAKDAPMLDVCMNGSQVILMGFSEEWAHVIVNGQTGFLPVEKLK